jgi:hypothetical protein
VWATNHKSKKPHFCSCSNIDDVKKFATNLREKRVAHSDVCVLLAQLVNQRSPFAPPINRKTLSLDERHSQLTPSFITNVLAFL